MTVEVDKFIARSQSLIGFIAFSDEVGCRIDVNVNPLTGYVFKDISQVVMASFNNTCYTSNIY